MDGLRKFGLMVALVVMSATCVAQAAPGGERAGLVGAWHLVALNSPGPDGKMQRTEGLKGTLIYTRDGDMAVEIMYPASAAGLTNEYVKAGYEASFGRYTVDEAAHTVTHHVEGSITPGLVGKDLARVFELSGKRLVVRSVRAEELWSVVWERD